MDKRNCMHRQELLPKIKDRNKLRKFRKKTAKCTGLWKCICGKGPRRPSTIQTKENHHAHASTQWQKAFPVLRAKRIFVQSLHCLHMTGLCLFLQPGMSLIQNRSGAAAPLLPKPGSFFTGDPLILSAQLGTVHLREGTCVLPKKQNYSRASNRPQKLSIGSRPLNASGPAIRSSTSASKVAGFAS